MTIKRSAFHFLCASPVLGMLFTFPKTYHWFVTILGRCIIPITLANFHLFHNCTYIGIKMGLSNAKETFDDSDSNPNKVSKKDN